MNNTTGSPSKVRHLLVLNTFSVALLLYLHRFCISYMQRYLKEDLGLTNDQLGWCFSAFFIAYALAQVPSGWLSDRFGARRMLAVYIVVWSIFTASMGLTMGFISLALVRVGVGLGQAGAYPTAAALLRRWVPFASRGKANSFVAFGGRFGAFIAPPLTAYMVIAFVPVSVDSLLKEGDLLDAPYLAVQLDEAAAYSDEPTAASSTDPLEESQAAIAAARHLVYDALPPRSREVAEALARAYRQAIASAETAEQEKAMPATSGPAPVEHEPQVSQMVDVGDDQRATLRDGLNKVISGENLYDEELFQYVKLEREAELLAARDALSEQQQQRLNRLLLEGLFPESIRKIYVHGWRQVIFVYGGLGIAVVLLYLIVFRDSPAEHPWCNDAERRIIEAGQPPPPARKTVGAVPMRAMLRSRSLWLMCINQFGGNVGWVFLMTWLPRYLLEVHEVPYIQRGWMAALPLSVGWVGMLLGGWMTDRSVALFGLRWRTAPIVLGRYVAAAAYLSCLFVPSAWAATAAFALIAFSNDLCNPSSWSYKQDIGGRYVGAVLGWANMWGNFGAALSPVLLQYIIQNHGWNATFTTGAAAFLIAGTAALGIDARLPIDKEEE